MFFRGKLARFLSLFLFFAFLQFLFFFLFFAIYKKRPSVSCVVPTQLQVRQLFSEWQRLLDSGDIDGLTSLYADDSVLLPTFSPNVLLTRDERLDYFNYFVGLRPRVVIDQSHVEFGCNWASDSGIYVFSFAEDGEPKWARYTYLYRHLGDKGWKVILHHSSQLPSK